MKKNILLTAVFASFFGVGIFGQTNFAVTAGIWDGTQKGGFQYSKNEYNRNLFIHISASHFKEKKMFGWAGGFTFGRIGTHFRYPLFFYDVTPSGEGIASYSENRMAPAQMQFNTFQFTAGPAMRILNVIELSVSPFVGFLGKENLADFGPDPRFVQPGTYLEMYNRFETGAMARLTTRINLGQHFSIVVQGHVGMTFSDLRKDAWENARAFLQDSPNGDEWIAFESTKLTRRYFGVSVGVGLK